MKTVFRKKFLKELAKIPSKTRTEIEKFVFEDVLELKNVADSGKIEKMKA